MQVVQIGREGLMINHLFFVDNSILFREATKEGAENVCWIICEYE